MRLYYDVETKHCVPDRKSPYDANLTYCSGWADYEGMGIAVIGYAIDDNPVKASLEPFTDFIDALKQPNVYVIGFNSVGFDDKLCQANNINVKTRLDLLEIIRFVAFGSTDWRRTPKGHKYSLGAIAKANNMSKTEDGANAPVLWQQGKRQQVIDYCKTDVDILRNVHLLLEQDKLINPNTGSPFEYTESIPF